MNEYSISRSDCIWTQNREILIWDLLGHNKSLLHSMLLNLYIRISILILRRSIARTENSFPLLNYCCFFVLYTLPIFLKKKRLLYIRDSSTSQFSFRLRNSNRPHDDDSFPLLWWFCFGFINKRGEMYIWWSDEFFFSIFFHPFF